MLSSLHYLVPMNLSFCNPYIVYAILLAAGTFWTDVCPLPGEQKSELNFAEIITKQLFAEHDPSHMYIGTYDTYLVRIMDNTY